MRGARQLLMLRDRALNRAIYWAPSGSILAKKYGYHSVTPSQALRY